MIGNTTAPGGAFIAAGPGNVWTVSFDWDAA